MFHDVILYQLGVFIAKHLGRNNLPPDFAAAVENLYLLRPALQSLILVL